VRGKEIETRRREKERERGRNVRACREKVKREKEMEIIRREKGVEKDIKRVRVFRALLLPFLAALRLPRARDQRRDETTRERERESAARSCLVSSIIHDDSRGRGPA